MIEARGAVLPIWEDVLPKVPDEELLEAAQRVAAAMDAWLCALLDEVERVRFEAVGLAMNPCGGVAIGASTRQKTLPASSSTQ